ncbi:SDR family NAD(P)-dependent oxidoreductase [Castellaniella sp. MT123]|uniref:SDR family NAD(P)-dependent oxidoreductase n=1 Tax=Castellaniella sp. MT123 TaxID=3140381 RepID=UPI0031F44163|nr:SDR family NAD(P)-dependent oxidoreductase [Castellaniella sp.]
MSKIALVTGASAGFGAAISRRLMAEGYTVVGAARRLDRLQALRAELGSGFHPLVMDVTDAASVEQGCAQVTSDFDGIDLLVNNAGLALGVAPAQDASMADWDRMIATNVLGLTRLVHTILPGMVRRNQGHIVNIGSVAGSHPYPGGNVYGATKAYVRQLSLNLRADLWGTQVRVTNIEPGLCGGTEFSVVRLGDPERAAAVYQGTDPLTADDVADAVAWVATRPARVNINTIELMPVSQAFAGLRIHRRT